MYRVDEMPNETINEENCFLKHMRRSFLSDNEIVFRLQNENESLANANHTNKGSERECRDCGGWQEAERNLNSLGKRIKDNEVIKIIA